jgi:hypothetical protein
VSAAHEVVPIKVTAWIDKGIAPLVVALNDFDHIVTLDSCEGDPEKGAYVLFRLWGDSEQAARFASDLARSLDDEAPSYLLQAEWRTGDTEPLLALSCPRDSVPALAGALSAARTTLSAGGSSRTEPRSSTASPGLRARERACGGTERC